MRRHMTVCLHAGLAALLIVTGSACVSRGLPPNSLGMAFQRIEPGTLARDGETIEIERPFDIGVYEVTQAQWEQVMGPSNLREWEAMGNTPLDVKDPSEPVRAVTPTQAIAFCRALSERDGTACRLPTRDEWEYACAAGSTTAYYWGDAFDGAYAWYVENSGLEVHPVGQKRPNPWGLYDMIGNVEEWTDPATGPIPGRWAFVCGGSSVSRPSHCLLGRNMRDSPMERFPTTGFRIVREVN